MVRKRERQAEKPRELGAEPAGAAAARWAISTAGAELAMAGML